MPTAAAELRAAIAAAGGVIPFDRFMAIALYGEHGFYSTEGRAGRRGDFITSPEVGPLFGAVLARAIADLRRRLGDPADFTVIEAGAGPGTLARALAGVAPHYIAVEVSAAQRRLQPDRVDSRAQMPAGPVRGVVLANELLDNLPFRLAVFDGAWREALVVDDCRGGFAEVLSAALDPLPPFLPPRAAHGARVPLLDAAASWVGEAVGRLGAGSVIAIDYTFAHSAQAATTPWRHWLRTYRGQSRGGHYLAAPGSQDITTQVCLDQLPPTSAVRPQAQFLRRWGIDELVVEGRAAWAAAAARPDVAALRMRSRVAEAEALTDPDGLGGFDVLEWTVGWR